MSYPVFYDRSYADSYDQVRTPIISYWHPEHLGRVILAGAVHIGSPAYYEQLQDIIDDHEKAGGIVHHEGIRQADPEDLLAATPADRAKARRLDRAIAIATDEIYTAFDGLVTQRTLKRGTAWKFPDATTLQLAEQASDREVFDFARTIRWAVRPPARIKALQEAFAKALDESFGTKDTGENGRLRKIRDLIHGINDDARDTRPYWMTGYREQIELDAIDVDIGRQPDTPVLAVWGDGHIPSFDAALRERGYEEVAERELVAIDISDFE